MCTTLSYVVLIINLLILKKKKQKVRVCNQISSPAFLEKFIFAFISRRRSVQEYTKCIRLLLAQTSYYET
jgi:hypothetical protein